MPKYSGGINLNLTWKGFGLGLLGEFNTGASHYFENGAADITNGMHVLTTYNDRKPFVIPNSSYNDGSGKYVANTDIKVSNANKSLYSRYLNTSSLYLVDAGFFKVREIVFSYEHTLKKGLIKRFNINVYGRNVFNFYSKNNIYGDPQLIKGPGSNRGYRTIPDNLTGSTSGVTTVPGIAQYGVITTVNF